MLLCSSLHASVLVSLGSPDLTNYPVTAALTPASSRTSVRCARRSSPAVTTYLNTRRSTVAPGPAGLSEPLCDTLSWPKPLPCTRPPSYPDFDQAVEGGFQDSLRTFGASQAELSKEILRAGCCPLIVSSLSLLPAVYLSLSLLSSSSYTERTTTSGKSQLEVDFLAFTHTCKTKHMTGDSLTEAPQATRCCWK